MAFCNNVRRTDRRWRHRLSCLRRTGSQALLQSLPLSPGLNDNVAGMLAYVTFIPAIIFLVMEPYNRSRFVRFHSLQCIFLFVAVAIVHFALGIVSAVPFMIFLTLPLHGLSPLRLDSFDLFGSKGGPGSDVQAARDRRPGGKTGERDVELRTAPFLKTPTLDFLPVSCQSY